MLSSGLFHLCALSYQFFYFDATEQQANLIIGIKIPQTIFSIADVFKNFRVLWGRKWNNERFWKKKLKRKSYKIWLNIHMSGFGIRLFYFETGSENSSVSEGTQTRFAWWAHSGCRSFRCLKVYFGFLRVIPTSTLRGLQLNMRRKSVKNFTKNMSIHWVSLIDVFSGNRRTTVAV